MSSSSDRGRHGGQSGGPGRDEHDDEHPYRHGARGRWRCYVWVLRVGPLPSRAGRPPGRRTPPQATYASDRRAQRSRKKAARRGPDTSTNAMVVTSTPILPAWGRRDGLPETRRPWGSLRGSPHPWSRQCQWSSSMSTGRATTNGAKPCAFPMMTGAGLVHARRILAGGRRIFAAPRATGWPW